MHSYITVVSVLFLDLQGKKYIIVSHTNSGERMYVLENKDIVYAKKEYPNRDHEGIQKCISP